ncbi:hypothetical protein SVAN01_04963 [Stagonosporopsis vannaccii]|nr:hypothetical protein SVAN01_04963 [Stagonosporopsis vannaccii]
MASPTDVSCPRPMQRRRHSLPVKPKNQANKVEKRAALVGGSPRRQLSLPKTPKGVCILNDLSKQASLSPSSCQSEHKPNTPPHIAHQGQASSIRYTDQDCPEPELSPPLRPLTAKNLQQHTLHTNPGERCLTVMTDSGSIKSTSKSEIQKLQNYGLVDLTELEWPPVIAQFVRDVLMKPRPHETPSADKIWQVLPAAREASSEADMATILAPLLMFRPQDFNTGSGEKSVSLCSDILLNKKYVEHPSRGDLSLSQPKPDRVNGYVSNWKTHGGVLTPAFTSAEERVLREMAELLHPDALCAWLSGEFKNNSGRSLHWAFLQDCRAGVAAVNHNREFFASAGVVVKEQDTAHFTIACDAENVVLHIHWYGDDNLHYVKRIFKADLRNNGPWGGKSAQMVEMRKILRNILEWAMGPRLNMIKDAIKTLCQRGVEDSQRQLPPATPLSRLVHRRASVSKRPSLNQHQVKRGGATGLDEGGADREAWKVVVYGCALEGPPSLWQVYEEGFDPVVKVLHVPTVELKAQHWLATEDMAAVPSNTNALLYAIYLSTLIFVEYDKCYEVLWNGRHVLIT